MAKKKEVLKELEVIEEITEIEEVQALEVLDVAPVAMPEMENISLGINRLEVRFLRNVLPNYRQGSIVPVSKRLSEDKAMDFIRRGLAERV